MSYQYVLWDFNGTLLDDVQVSLDVMNELLTKRGMELLDLTKYRSVFTFPVIEYYRRVGILDDDSNFDEVAHEWMNLYYSKENQVKVFSDTIETLEWFKSQGIPQGVLSASQTIQLERLLKQVGIDGYMQDILGISDIYAKSKVHIGLEFIAKSQYNKEEIVMIGDSTHDAEVAKEMGIDCILLACGHQSKEVLETTGCLVLEQASALKTLSLWRK